MGGAPEWGALVSKEEVGSPSLINPGIRGWERSHGAAPAPRAALSVTTTSSSAAMGLGPTSLTLHPPQQPWEAHSQAGIASLLPASTGRGSDSAWTLSHCNTQPPPPPKHRRCCRSLRPAPHPNTFPTIGSRTPQPGSRLWSWAVMETRALELGSDGDPGAAIAELSPK
uniref:Uncharacterized protein n=1 Tax=Melopsittacus undulatus TaxID=13146 RepID=A0A8V5GKT6_MELUD